MSIQSISIRRGADVQNVPAANGSISFPSIPGVAGQLVVTASGSGSLRAWLYAPNVAAPTIAELHGANSVNGTVATSTFPIAPMVVGTYKLILSRWHSSINDEEHIAVFINVTAVQNNFASIVEWGVVGDHGFDPQALGTVASDLRLKWYRVWHTLPGDIGNSEAAHLRAIQGAGIKVIMTVNPPERGHGSFAFSDFNAADWVSRNRSAIESCVTILSVGNEWNFDNYRPLDLGPTNWHGPYVDRFLKPLRLGLPNTKISTVASADNNVLAVHSNIANALKSAGAYQLADFADIHPYTTMFNLAGMEQAIKAVRATTALPLISTEFNVVTNSPQSEWFNTFPSLANIAKQNLSIACYYRLNMSNNPNQKALLDSNNAKLAPYYDQVKQVFTP